MSDNRPTPYVCPQCGYKTITHEDLAFEPCPACPEGCMQEFCVCGEHPNGTTCPYEAEVLESLNITRGTTP
jgi:hypothetical protein